MKRIFKFYLLIGTLLLCQNLSAQNINPPPEADFEIGIESYEYNEVLFTYYNQMQHYILDKSAEPMPKDLKEMIQDAKEDHGHFSKADLTSIIRDYWKFDFIAQFPQPEIDVALRGDGTDVCENGGFEDDFSGYDRFRSIFNDHFPKCDPKKSGQPLIWEYLIPNPVTYPLDYPYDLKIVDDNLDPNIPANFNFNQVRFGDHALKINEIKASANGQCGVGSNGINKITKEFIVDESHEKFAIWYATVLQDPANHKTETTNDKPFFNIQFYNSENVLVDELCWDSTEDFFIDHPTRRTSCGNESNVRFQPWTCNVFDFAGFEGQELRMEIIAADCGKGGHFGYAYVDGICEFCATIDISAAPAECSDLPYEVSGNVDILDSDVSNLNLISLVGKLVGDDSSEIEWNITNYNSSTGNFSTLITAAHLNPGVCYDFYVVGTLQDGTNNPFEVRSATLIQGEFNDFCTEDFSSTRLNYTYTVDCIDIGHPRNITNDEYTITLDIITSGPDVEWEVIRSGYDVIASGVGSQTIEIGPYKYQECDYFEIYDPLCDKTHFLNIEYDCPGCINAFRICEHEIICDDNGTPGDFSDDLWSITWVVESEDNVGNWAITTPNFIGNYNEVTTIFMGELNNYGATHSFKVYDPVTRCILKYTVDLPPGCKNCTTEYIPVVSDCRLAANGMDYIYMVDIILPGGIGDCLNAIYIEIGDNDYLPLPILTGSNGNISLGPFYVGAGPFTLLIEDCYGCMQEVVVFPPFCKGRGLNNGGGDGIGYERGVPIEKETLFEAFPNPTSNMLNLNISDFESSYDLNVINMFGQSVMQLNNFNGDQNLDLNKLSAGVYHLVISQASKVVWTERIVKI